MIMKILQTKMIFQITYLSLHFKYAYCNDAVLGEWLLLMLLFLGWLHCGSASFSVVIVNMKFIDIIPGTRRVCSGKTCFPLASGIQKMDVCH